MVFVDLDKPLCVVTSRNTIHKVVAGGQSGSGRAVFKCACSSRITDGLEIVTAGKQGHVVATYYEVCWKCYNKEDNENGPLHMLRRRIEELKSEATVEKAEQLAHMACNDVWNKVNDWIDACITEFGDEPVKLMVGTSELHTSLKNFSEMIRQSSTYYWQLHPWRAPLSFQDFTFVLPEVQDDRSNA